MTNAFLRLEQAWECAEQNEIILVRFAQLGNNTFSYLLSLPPTCFMHTNISSFIRSLYIHLMETFCFDK